MKKINNLYIIILTVVFLYAGNMYAASPSLKMENSTGLPAENPLLPPVDSNSVATPEAVQAQVDTSIKQTDVEAKKQAAVFDQPGQKSSSTVANDIQSSIAGAVGCAAGQVLGSIISSLVSSALTTGINAVVEEVVDITNVPVAEKGQVLINSNTQTNAKVGTATGLFGISTLVLPSWDAIAYCVVNAMITYVANSTIAWVQGGFQGNPSFVNNPGEFFKDLANVEAGAFLKELAYGATGLNICQPFRAQIVLSIARSHVSGQQGYGGNNGYSQGGFGGGGGNVGYGGCTLDTIKGNLDGFLHGDFQRGGWDSWFQISQVNSNNPYSTYFSLQAQLDGAINKKQNIANLELNWGKGFLSFRKCDEKTAEADKSKCPITTPGIVIQGQLEKTLGLSKDRLVLAQKFDQVIAAVVNELIATALDKVLESTQE